jgi:hypothetical protein
MKPLMLLVLVAALGSSVCRKSDVSKLEELPKDIAENLKRIPDSDVLISIAPIASPNPQPTPMLSRACSETQDFLVQVIYPVTVCTPFDLLPGRFMADAPPRSAGAATTTVKSYKLSAFEGQPLTTPFGCQKRGGPFLAKITRTVACNNATSCSMQILGVPSCPACPSFVWSGDNCEVNNRPAEVRFIDPPFAQGKPTFSPCSALTNCGTTPTPSPIP